MSRSSHLEPRVGTNIESRLYKYYISSVASHITSLFHPAPNSIMLLAALLLAATSLVSAAAIEKRQSTTQIYKFSSPTSAEGIAVRSNGQILVSFFDKGEFVGNRSAKTNSKYIL